VLSAAARSAHLGPVRANAPPARPAAPGPSRNAQRHPARRAAGPPSPGAELRRRGRGRRSAGPAAPAARHAAGHPGQRGMAPRFSAARRSRTSSSAARRNGSLGSPCPAPRLTAPRMRASGTLSSGSNWPPSAVPTATSGVPISSAPANACATTVRSSRPVRANADRWFSSLHRGQ
jgi:hypothetical protein